MKFYSESLNKLFETEQALVEAETAEADKKAAEEAHAKQLAATRKDRAKAIEESYKRVVEARQEYKKLVDEFTRDYGSFHMSVKGDNLADMDLFDLFKYAFSW
jgi:hypothetical protein